MDRYDCRLVARWALIGIMMRCAGAASCALSVVPSVGNAAEDGSPTAKRPNFVFLLVDDLGWADFGCYGATFNETPNIDRLARQGMRFRHAYSACTVCSPSRAAVLTGCYPARLHLTDWIKGHVRPHARLAVPQWNMRIEHQRQTLPEALREAGYRTGFFGKWHLMPIGDADFDQHYPTDHGFDVNVGGREWGQPRGRGRYFSPFDMPNLDDGEEGDFLTDRLTDEAIDFLDRSNRDQPFLLYFSYYTLHGPVMSPPETAARYEAKAKTFENRNQEYIAPQRAGMVEHLDRSVGRILRKLAELGIADETVVMLTGDNGGNFDGTTGGLRDFKGFSHEGGTRQPLVVHWPQQTAANSICDETVIGMDVYPTLLEMAGLALRPEEHQDGLSLVPLLTGSAERLSREAVYWHYPHYHRTDPYGAVRRGNWKLIEFFEDGAMELFDLSQDPEETNNLAPSMPNKALALLADLQQWRTSVGAQMMPANPDYDPVRDQNRIGRRKRPPAKVP